jgi:osmotically inducible protein OsmC
MQRTATAVWTGDLKAGSGTVRVGSGAFEGPYSFRTRFEDAPGTNPEELLGAAHAGCFAMALSLALSTAGHVPTAIDTTATVTMEKVGDKLTITRIDLAVRGQVPGIAPAEFARLAEETKTGCIVSRALAAVPMTLDARLA